MFIKGFDKDLKCRGFQFEIGKEYKIESDKPLELCSDTVFHFCRNIENVHSYYSVVGKNNRFCEIEVLGDLVEDGTKCGSNQIKIVREIVGEELDLLIGRVNGNTGIFNTGDCNTGDRNTGNRNTGDRNTGYCNTGDRNTGYCNTGDCNTGDRNTGYCNTGYCNTGYWNTGYCNTGYWNTGDFNICNYSSGFFCTKEPKAIIFDIETDMTVSEFRESKYYLALYSSHFNLTEWINYTEEEMQEDETKRNIGGYLKQHTFEEACANWWSKMSEENKKIIQEIPNFDKEKFYKITGIKL